MPGKINPVIPEVINQIAFNIIGNDTTITMAVEAGQLELNAFEPIIFYCLFESLETLTNGIKVFTTDCIEGLTVNQDICENAVEPRGSCGKRSILYGNGSVVNSLDSNACYVVVVPHEIGVGVYISVLIKYNKVLHACTAVCVVSAASEYFM